MISTPYTHTEDEIMPSAYSEDLGTIEVRLRRVRDFISVPFVPKTSTKPSPVAVHERSKKGRGPNHCVSCVFCFSGSINCSYACDTVWDRRKRLRRNLPFCDHC